MNAAAERLEFTPPPQKGAPRAFGLAVLAHLLLVAALTWGLQWKSSTDTPIAEAELWSSVPKEAAPKPVEATPLPPPPPAPPAPPAPPVRPVPQPDKADIALEKERQRQQALKKEQQEARLLEQRKREELKLAEKKRAEQKAALDKKRQQEEQAEKAALAKKQQELDKKREEQDARRAQEAKALQARKLEEDRKANMQRLAGLAGATGAPNATGSALQSSGPSASYGSRVAAKVKPNIVFTEEPANNPMAVVEVRAAPDGTIVGRKLQKPSGNKAWDDAVLRAIDKTERLPRDVDGRVPAELEISFRPRD